MEREQNIRMKVDGSEEVLSKVQEEMPKVVDQPMINIIPLQSTN